jgi:hypothetical protein
MAEHYQFSLTPLFLLSTHHNIIYMNSELMFGLGQTKKKKETEAKVRQTKAEEWNYKGRIDQDGMILERKEKAEKDKKWKEEQRQTKSKLKDVTQEEDGLSKIRKEQHNRDEKWKETKRGQAAVNRWVF